MRFALVPLFALLPALAQAQDLVDTLRGTYGSATDPAGSCEVVSTVLV